METVLTPLDMLAVEGDGLAVVVEIVLMEAVEAFDVVVVSVVIVAVGGDELAVVVEIVLMGAVEAFDVVVVSVVIAVSVMYLKYNF